MMILKRSPFAWGAAFALLWSFTNIAAAAPPTLTHLYPAGAQVGTTASITVSGTLPVWPVTFLTSHPGLTATPEKAKGQIKLTVTPQVPPGWHWLRAVSADGVSNPRVFCVGQLPELLEKEANDTPDAAQAVTIPAIVNGKLGKSGDVDGFAVTLKKGQTLVANLEANHTLRSPMDAILQIVSTNGFVLQHDHDTVGLDPRIVFTAPADGAYIVRTFAFPADPNSSIHFMGADTYVYRLTLTTGGFADYPWPLAVQQGTAAQVRLTGPNIPTDAPLVAVPSRGTDTRFDTVSNGTNTVPVWREPYPCFTTDSPAVRVPPFVISGKLPTNGAAQTIPFTAKKGQRLEIQTRAREIGLATTPLLQVTDTAGTQLARAEPSKPESDTSLVFVARADGEYRVVVRDLFGHGSPRHVFLLQMATAEPDFALTLASERITVTPGKPTDVAVTITTQGGFKSDVDVKVEGLPKGATAAPTGEPAKKGATRTVTLRFTAHDPVEATRIRIIGVSKDKTPQTRVATATVAELPVPVSECWLTVLKVPTAKASTPKNTPKKP